MVFLAFGTLTRAQQASLYSQYMLAMPVLNPAYSGAPNKVEFLAGYHRQWLDVSFSPVSNFVNVIYTRRGNYNYSGTHVFGGYVEQEKRGVIISRVFHFSYSYHLKLNNGYKMGLGIAVGSRNVALLSVAYSTSDPALMQTKSINMIPDITPGIRIQTKKLTFDASIRQLYKNKVSNGGNKIGIEMKEIPHLYLTLCRKFTSELQDYSFIPCIHLQSAITTKPLLNLALLSYYKGRIGVGISHTLLNSFTGMLHVRITKKSILGISYSYATNALKYVSPTTFEIIFGFTPIKLDDAEEPKKGLVNCPNFEY